MLRFLDWYARLFNLEEEVTDGSGASLRSVHSACADASLRYAAQAVCSFLFPSSSRQRESMVGTVPLPRGHRPGIAPPACVNCTPAPPPRKEVPRGILYKEFHFGISAGEIAVELYWYSMVFQSSQSGIILGSRVGRTWHPQCSMHRILVAGFSSTTICRSSTFPSISSVRNPRKAL